ncbi:CPBP family intramembrane glutamic endopeptidase [Streptomyces sp. NPDC048710]|uniref:CPBP family intramembrane glutamic endopeptidase n=1 Tax=unclassified Streptomyces TaxID=2593676 RepID=UPI0037118330
MSTQNHVPSETMERAGRPAPAQDSHVIAAPAGTPYHRLARTERYRWWQPLVATLVAGAGWWLSLFPLGFVLGGAAALAGVELGGPQDLLFADPLWNDATLLLMLALMLPMVLLAARQVQRRPAGSLSSVTGRVRWRWLLVCLGVAVAAAVLLIFLAATLTLLFGAGVDGAASNAWVGWPTFLASALVFVLLVPFQAAAEEYVFRGWIPQVFGCYLRTPWVGGVVGALLFALAHGLGTPWGFADLVLFGLVLSFLVIRTGGLEAAVAYHVGTNLVLMILAATTAGGVADHRTAADGSWELLVAGAVALALYAWVVLHLSRRLHIARTAPAPVAVPASAVSGSPAC